MRPNPAPDSQTSGLGAIPRGGPISIGILARNAQDSIELVLRSLAGQTLLTQAAASGLSVEIRVVANGCTDQTAEVSRARLAELFSPLAPSVQWWVDDVAQAGKSNAWNLFVHTLSSRDARFLFLIDADIEFGDAQTMEKMVEALRADQHAAVSTSLPVKNIHTKGNKTMRERLSLAFTRRSQQVFNTAVWICGQSYCGRSEVLRRFVMPVGLPVEDGFLTAMVRTDAFTTPEDTGKVIGAAGAHHYFEAILSLPLLLRHEKRVVLGMAVNMMLCDYLQATCHLGSDAGALIKKKNEEDPRWLRRLLDDARDGRRWMIPRGMLFRRFALLRSRGPASAAVYAPMVLAAFMVDLVLFTEANRMLREGSALGYW